MSGLPPPIPSEVELVEIIADAVFSRADNYPRQLEACGKFDRISDLIRRVLDAMINAPGRVEAATIAARLAGELSSESDRARRDLAEYAEEESEERSSSFNGPGFRIDE